MMLLSGYVTDPCERCGVLLTQPEPRTEPWVCSACLARAQVAQLDPAQLRQLRAVIHEEGKIPGIQAIRAVMNVPLKDAIDILGVVLDAQDDQERKNTL